MKSKILKVFLITLLGFSGMVFAENTPKKEIYEEALRKEAEAIAESHQISFEDALRRLRLQAAARNGIVAQLKKEFKDRLAGIYIDHEIDDRLVVRLKGLEKIKDRIIKIDEYDLRVIFEAGQKYSVEEIGALLKEKRGRLLKEIKNIQATFVDETTGEIVLVVLLKEKDNVLIEELKVIGESILNHPVKIKKISSAIFELTSVGGGGILSSGCTAGFAVKKSKFHKRGYYSSTLS